jgi:hypothetical protein
MESTRKTGDPQGGRPTDLEQEWYGDRNVAKHPEPAGRRQISRVWIVLGGAVLGTIGAMIVHLM